MKKILLITLLIVIILISNKKTEAFGECNQYGYLAMYDSFSGTCSCMSGYSFGKDFMGQTSCISNDQLCKNQYGYNATSDYLSNKCKCSYGYGFSKDYSGNLSCVSLSKICSDKLGYNSDYDSLSDSCKCNSGYTIGENGQCVEKQNNVYFLLKELDISSKKAIVKSDYDYRTYLISYGVGCYDFSINRYLNKKIVINLGTDYTLDTWDKIVLQDDDEICNITSKEKVDYDFTLVEKKTIYTPQLLGFKSNELKYTKNMQLGSSGAEVKKLQIQLGVSPADGYFGSITKKAVIKYQKDNNIYPTTGSVGLLTRNLLNR